MPKKRMGSHVSRPPEAPEERMRKGLPAAVRVWETPTHIYCNIWWGREGEAGSRLHKFSLFFPYPNPIPKGGGIFEEIIYLLKNLTVEIYTIGPQSGEGYEYADYAKALKQIGDTAISVIIIGDSYYEGKKPEYTTVVTTQISFLKKEIQKHNLL